MFEITVIIDYILDDGIQFISDFVILNINRNQFCIFKLFVYHTFVLLFINWFPGRYLLYVHILSITIF